MPEGAALGHRRGRVAAAAREPLGIAAYKSEGRKAGGWLWALPGQMTPWRGKSIFRKARAMMSLTAVRFCPPAAAASASGAPEPA